MLPSYSLPPNSTHLEEPTLQASGPARPLAPWETCSSATCTKGFYLSCHQLSSGDSRWHSGFVQRLLKHGRGLNCPHSHLLQGLQAVLLLSTSTWLHIQKQFKWSNRNLFSRVRVWLKNEIWISYFETFFSSSAQVINDSRIVPQAFVLVICPNIFSMCIMCGVPLQCSEWPPGERYWDFHFKRKSYFQFPRTQRLRAEEQRCSRSGHGWGGSYTLYLLLSLVRKCTSTWRGKLPPLKMKKLLLKW